MKSKYYTFIAVLLFIMIAVVSTKELIISDGMWSNYDRPPRLDVDSFREYFFSLHKWHGGANLDDQKRIIFEWIYLLFTQEQEEKFHFTLVVFFILFNFYFVCLKLIKEYKYPLEGEGIHIIAFAAAFLYFANPLGIHIFIRLYTVLSYAIFPLLFYSLIMLFRSEKMRYAVMFGTFTAVLFLFVIHNLLYITLSFIGVAFISLYYERKNLKKIVEKTAVKLAVAAGVFLLLTAFIMLPVLYITLVQDVPQPGYIHNEEYVLLLTEKTSMFNTMVLDLNLYKYPQIYYEYPSDTYYLIMAVVFSLAVAAALLKPTRLSLMLLTTSILFIFLSKSITPPLGEIYDFLVFKLPAIGWMFRDGTKFTYMFPFFFSMLVAHALATVGKKEILAGSVISVLSISAIFAWPIWTGDLDGNLVKYEADTEFMEVISILKQDDDYRSKVAWYGDYIESAPIKALRSGRVDILAMRQLLDDGNSVVALEELADELGLKYLLIDSRPTRHYYYVGYAEYANDEAQDSFEHIYGGERLELYKTNNASEMFYIPDEVITVYSGFRSLYPIFEEQDNRFAVVFADKTIHSSDSLEFADTVVFGSENDFALSLEPANMVPFGTGILTDEYNGWSTGRESDQFHSSWLRMLESKEISSDQWLYENYVLYTEEIHGKTPENSRSLTGIFSDSVEQEIADYSLMRSNLTEIEGNWLSISGEGRFTNVAAFVIVDFFDSEKSYLKSERILASSKLHETIDKEIEVPSDASYFRIEVYASLLKGREGSISLKLDDISLNSYGLNYFDKALVIPEDDEYEIFLRVFRSPCGGEFSAALDDNGPVILRTESNVTGFTWIKIYEGYLAEGKHGLSITNLGGLNAVNIAYYRKTGENDIHNDARLDGKKIMYVFESSDFENNSVLVDIYRAGNYTMIPSGKTLDLAEGEHVLEAEGDYLILYSDGDKKKTNAEILSYERKGLSTYEVTVDSEKPYFLVFTEGHNELWRLSSGDEELGPFPVYSLVNGFYVNNTGTNTMTVYYGPQPWHEAGLLVSGIGYLVVFLFFINEYFVRWRA
jgi:hypothetical protein